MMSLIGIITALAVGIGIAWLACSCETYDWIKNLKNIDFQHTYTLHRHHTKDGITTLDPNPCEIKKAFFHFQANNYFITRLTAPDSLYMIVQEKYGEDPLLEEYELPTNAKNGDAFFRKSKAGYEILKYEDGNWRSKSLFTVLKKEGDLRSLFGYLGLVVTVSTVLYKFLAYLFIIVR